MSGGTTTLVVRGTGAECRKFAPNIFNKSKCSSCFKQKEEHSAEALECNRATRKISKCGYLFVAPGWDFSNPLNRTKRWQRRWFVLYDDGELTYSVDEHPETVPQARIDMTRVLEVAAAEDVTGHPYSLAITSPEGVTFVKGTCREETRWWADVLQVYSRNKGRHKRNATFPGGQTTILQVTPTIRSNTPNPPRPRFNSCRSEPARTGNAWLADSSNGMGPISPSFPPSPLVGNSNGNGDVATSSTRVENVNSPHAYLTSPSAGFSSPSPHPAPMNGTPVAVSTVYSTLPTISSIVTAGYSGSSTTSSMCSPLTDKPPMIPSDVRSTTTTTTTTTTSTSSSYRDQPASSASPPTRDKLRAEDKARRRMNQQGERRSAGTAAGRASADEKLEDDACRRILLEHEREREGKLRDIAASLTQPRARRSKPRISEPTRDVVDAANAAHRDKLIRGDPDGCGLDIPGSRYSPTSELRVDLPAEDLLNIKKGWLMKQGANKEWNKHWFVLRGCGLMYYRDPCAEDKGIMDGVIDLNTVTAVTPLQVARNYGFQTVAWDERGSTVFSAVTAGIRSSWMSAIRRAANLPDPEDGSADTHALCQDSQPEINSQSPTASITDRDNSSVVPSVSVTPRSVLFSSDEEYRTASEGGRRESGDWSEMPVSPPLARNGDWSMALKVPNWPSSDGGNHEWSELPPSPPLTRTALSRVKARSRSSSRSRVYKRSRSSPPSSRRSTLDSVGSEDLVMACCELRGDAERADGRAQSNECLPAAVDDDDDTLRKNPLIVDLLENQVSLLREHLDHNNQSQPSALLVIVERQASEIEGLKSQLKAARSEVSGAEKELARLRQQKAEAAIREKRLEEMLGTMQRSEQQRSKDLDDLEKAKKLYNRDRESLQCKVLETEAILRETSERCEVLTNELASSHRTVEHLQDEVATLSDRLSRGIEENERLYNRVRELEGKGSLSAARERGRSFDSLSDLTNIDLDLDLNALDKERITEEYEELRSRFEKAILEIRAMRKELREAHAMQDALELEIFAHKQSAANASETNQSQTRLMAARIQDLTSKLGTSEKQARALRQKLTKAETRDKRRSLSLKGREALQVSQEVEEKLLDLENKVRAIEAIRSASAPVSAGNSSKESSPNPRRERKRDTKSLDRSRIRRKSLDSATSSEPIKLLIRLNNLETRVANVADNANSDAEKDSSECSEVSASSGSEVSTEILCRLKKLERAVARSKRRLEKCLGSTQAEDRAEKCLREVNEILESVQDCKRGQSHISESVGMMVSRLEGILREKLAELAERRRVLAQSGRLDDRAKTQLLAERLAFETVVLGRVKAAASRSGDRSTVLAELVETSQLVTSLKRKVRDAKPKTHDNTSYLRCLVDALANKLSLLGDEGNAQEPDANCDNSSSRLESLQFLARKQKEANDIVRSYKDTKLKQLADALAVETLEISEQEDLTNSRQTSSSGKKLLEDRRIREAWAVAQETVSKELVQTEVFHVITRCGQVYEQSVGSIADVCLNLDASPVELESWIDEAQSRLRHEMELSVRELSEAYEDSLRLMKANRVGLDSNRDSQGKSRQLLMDYADVIAHKALIDAKISLLRDGARPTSNSCIPGEGFVSNLVRNEDLLACLVDEERLDVDEDPVVNAEYVYLFQKFARDCDERITGKRGSKDQLKNVGQALSCLEEDLEGLALTLRTKTGCENVDSTPGQGQQDSPSDWPGVCEKCAQLRERIKQLTDLAKASSCRQCVQLQETIQRLTREHTEELETLKKNQERDLMDIKGELDNQRHSLTSQYEQEAASLRERARKLEQRLNAMDSEHSAHVNELRVAYQRSISAELDTDAETRKRYKEEIKQLRALCEKGLLAMENSQRRIIAEMEEKHRQELESLRVEKEQALSEETQATLAALDAMRKAHEHEVQKEIAKFKQEFIKQVQAREDIGALHKEHEEEMEEIKREILSLSAKYSSKCVESAALEEKVGTLAKQLAQAQQHIMQLDARNKQLRAHLMLEANDVGDAMQMLRGRETEIAEQREEIHRLQQQLKHGDSPREPAKSAGETGKVPAEETRSAASSSSGRGPGEKICRGSLSTQRKSQSVDRPTSGFSYKLERLKSISLPYASALLAEKTPESQERNGLALWDSLRPRSGLPHQYQGGTAEMRLGGVGAARGQEAEQNQEQQRQQRADAPLSSRLTPEPPTLSVAELMRSPAVRWSSRSCRSLPPTPTPSYHHPLHLPLPAVGMVAERKKRFEL